MRSISPDWLGWLASAAFLSSYAFKDQTKLRRVQALAALLWAVYGAILHAVPIVVANLLVAAAAVYSSLAAARVGKQPATVSDGSVRPAGEPDLSRIS